MPTRLIALLVAALAGGSLVAAGPRPAQSDLDEFMKAVMARRDENWKKLQQYILDEREVVELRGPGRIPVWGEVREYTWYIRDGFFVRSPVKANGVTVPEEDRVKYETEYLERARRREAREQEEAAREAAARAPDEPSSPTPVDPDALFSDLRRPMFIDQAYFLEFKFEQGKYALVGRETFEGREVLRIEYYPERLFDDERHAERERRSDDREAAFERMMNKVSLVTLWVEPSSHQIVRYTFDNVNLDFLPGAWLVRVTDLTASMTMSQPFPDVWLPREIDFRGGVMLAAGPFDVRYEIDFSDYREATTSGRIKREPQRP